MAYQIHLPVQIQTPSGNGKLAALYAERDRLLERWERALDAVEFDERAWLAIDAELRAVLDRIECAEMTERIKAQGN